MLLFLLTIGITSLLVVVFKLFVKWDVDSFQAIVYNYLVCLVLGSILLGEVPFRDQHLDADWFPFVFAMGLIFIIGFNFAAETVRYFGVAVTAVVQRVSLVISAGFAIAFYQEPFGSLKALGIILAIVSIVLINYKPRTYSISSSKTALWLLPLGTWMIGGGLESLLYYLSAEGISRDQELHITTHGFGIAGGIGFLVLLAFVVAGKKRFSMKALLAGILLGIPNYFSIYLIFLLLNHGFEGSFLFPVLNISVLVIGAISGVLFFLEKLYPRQLAGIVLACLSIAILSFTLS